MEENNKRSLMIGLATVAVFIIILAAGFFYALTTLSRGFVDKPTENTSASETTDSRRLPNASTTQ